MKRRIIITIAAALLLTAGILLNLWRTSRKPMPVYQGKTADQWLVEIFSSNQLVALQAFHEMGTNAFPVLVEAFKKRDSAWRRAYARIYRKLPNSWQKHLAPPVQPQNLWSAAQLVLINNQREAKKLLPELARLLENKSLESRQYVISTIIPLVGPINTECVPGLMSCLGETNKFLRVEAIEGLGQIGPGAKESAPALMSALADTNVEIRVSAAHALWNVNHETNFSVPALRKALSMDEVSVFQFRRPGLTKYWALMYLHEINPADLSLIPAFIDELQSPNNDARNIAVMYLGEYGSSASAAVPALTNFLDSQDLQLRQQVLGALKKIDPKTAAKYDNK